MMDNAPQIADFGDYGSEFEYDSEIEKKRRKRDDLAKPVSQSKTKLPEKNVVSEEYSKEVHRHERFHLLTLDAYSRHKKFVNDYLLYYGGSRKEFIRDTSKDKTDFDVLRENHKFLWDDNDDSDLEKSWEKRLAKRYYDKLFKEYCIGDLSRYKENKIALRWRTEAEVISGKGQFACGEKRCPEKEQLKSWEVNFVYIEQSQKKNALVKIRLCPECSHKLNYHHRKREIRKRKIEKSLSPEKEEGKKLKTEDQTEEIVSKETEETSESEKEQEKRTAGSSSDSSLKTKEEEIWTRSQPVTDEKPREDEFEEYFEDMFL